MIRARFTVVFAILGTLGLWGCTQQSGDGPANRATRLQDEIKGLTTIRDQLRQELRAAQKERDALGEEVAKLKRHIKDRDEQLAARTTERDNTQANLDSLRKGIKSLMEQATGMGPMRDEQAPVTAAAAPSVEKS